MSVTPKQGDFVDFETADGVLNDQVNKVWKDNGWDLVETFCGYVFPLDMVVAVYPSVE